MARGLLAPRDAHVPAAGQRRLHARLPERCLRSEPRDRAETSSATSSCVTTPSCRATSWPNPSCGWQSSTSSTPSLARPGSDPALVSPPDRRDRANERVPSGPRLPQLQDPLRSSARHAEARSALRDLRPLDRDGGHSPARGQGRARRHPLVGPDGGLPHRGARADEDADDEECRHRPDRVEGRVRRAPQRAAGSSSATRCAAST